MPICSKDYAVRFLGLNCQPQQHTELLTVAYVLYVIHLRFGFDASSYTKERECIKTYLNVKRTSKFMTWSLSHVNK